MNEKELSKEQLEELEKFGANSWFVEYLLNQYNENPDQLPDQWKEYFGYDPSEKGSTKIDSSKGKSEPEKIITKKIFEQPKPSKQDELKIIAGSSARVLDNMTSSLSIPTATSQRVIPVKLLEENRIIINNHLQKIGGGKISYTHLIAYAIVMSLKKFPVMNNAFTESNGKPYIIKRKNVNIGIAVDVLKKDGSRSLIVPNIKNVDELNFRQFISTYEDLIKRTRSGQIDPEEFQGTTVTLTNPGTIGTVTSIPRLMMGQGLIIATGAIQYPAEYLAMSPDTISTLGISKVITITSTYDHRIIQGAESGMFLKEINDLLLGSSNFYDTIFNDLNIPLKPTLWQTDIQPQGFNNGSNVDDIEKQARVLQLINMYRVRGHLTANINPLATNIAFHEELDPSFHRLTLWDLDRTFITGGFGGIRTATLRQILGKLQRTYCEKIGVEYMHIQNPIEKAWMQQKMEPSENNPKLSEVQKKQITKKLIEAENFEHFIHNKFVGHKRFSIEGNEALIPLLDFILNQAADSNVEEIVLGMAHRGRLNVLANIIGKNLESIFSEFEDIVDPNSIAGSGDVKYHLGATGDYPTLNGKQIKISVASNPSHLEWVNPVVEGIVRAKQTRKNDTERNKIIALLIHGDAAFAGQGVVAETLNLSQLKGYRTGGTIHLIVNNQIGFTTTPEEARSSVYATDIAKMVQAPIFHVNGDDPEAVLWCAALAFEYRQTFNKDVVIDILGYRRHGHNEGDEPGFTQPLLYSQIRKHPSVQTLYSNKLIKEKIIDSKEYEFLVNEYNQKLNSALEKIKLKHIEFKTDIPLAVSKEKISSSKQIEKTSVDESVLTEIVLKSTSLPEGFHVHPKLKKFLDKRREFTYDDALADWAFAEYLAFASLLNEGIPVRLSGQDSVRGTFSQRHLSFRHLVTGEEFFPLNNIKSKQGNLEALDSLLSEAAVLGFEYGYSTADPLALVLWEAQFGDFVNCAQVIIDNFIVVSNEKWQVPNNVVLLLPHGFEGQGPEHSSARLERFLILCAEGNMEVCYLTTPAQYFHVLRRQMKKAIRRPLVIMTPKSLLRLPEARSMRTEFIHGNFQEIIDDNSVVSKDKIERLIITSGKVYYELFKYKTENNIDNTAIVRVEQLYPFESEKMQKIIDSYSNLSRAVWVQEEPKNMGAWNFIKSYIFEMLPKKIKLEFSGRAASASPAVGSSKLSNKQQEQLIVDAFTK